jgi:hypothetical protein
VREVRFANLNDGWAYLPDLWATHDGGAHWAQQSIGQVLALEAAAGLVHAVGGPDEANAFTIRTSPVHSDAWRQSDTKVTSGAGPVPQVDLVLHGDTGWLVGIDRTVAGGARLEAGRWVTWRPPCMDTGGGVMLAAATTADVVAFCDEGVWNDRPQAERVYASSDAGSTFQRVPTPVPVKTPSAVAAAASNAWVVGGSDSDATAVLVITVDGGRTWKTIHRGENPAAWADLGFTSSRQGVVISQGKIGRLLMTFDGGQTWMPVDIR